MEKSIHGERVQLIADDMKQCFKDLGLPIHGEMPKEMGISIMSMFEYQSHNIRITASFYPEVNLVDIVLQYAQVPEEKLPRFLDLLNRINQNLVMGYYSVQPDHHFIQLRASFRVTRYSLNKEEFKDTLKLCLETGICTISMPIKLMFTDETPESIVNEHLKNADAIPPEFLGPDGKIKFPRISEDCPFLVDGCADMPAFPTHTHGLTKVGMPEFLIDHLAFGPKGNGDRINLSYDYFKKPENADKLEAIRRGETITLTIQDLDPKANPEQHPYCYRRVYPDFEMVKQAYILDDQEEVGPDTWFVQIYVEGDDFALTDDYYRGGIKW